MNKGKVFDILYYVVAVLWLAQILFGQFDWNLLPSTICLIVSYCLARWYNKKK